MDRAIEGNEIYGISMAARLGQCQGLVERAMDHTSTALEPAACASVVNEDLTHGLRGGGVKVGAVGPRGLTRAEEFEKGFVDERSGLKGVIAPLGGHRTGRARTELRVNHRHEFAGRRVVSGNDSTEDNRGVSHGVSGRR
jgi:hypothetical protein